MVAVPKPSAKVRQQLPVLSRLVEGLAYVAAKLPEAAAREMVLAVQYDWRRGQDPYGSAWAPVEGRRYDPNRTIANDYYPVVSGTDAIIANDHRASRALQVKDPRNSRPGRRSHPTDGMGLGTWQKRIEKMNRDLLYGAVMGGGARAARKEAAALRRTERFEARNRARIASGLKPLAPRRVRSDRARVDAMVVRAIG